MGKFNVTTFFVKVCQLRCKTIKHIYMWTEWKKNSVGARMKALFKWGYDWSIKVTSTTFPLMKAKSKFGKMSG